MAPQHCQPTSICCASCTLSQQVLGSRLPGLWYPWEGPPPPYPRPAPNPPRRRQAPATPDFLDTHVHGDGHGHAKPILGFKGCRNTNHGVAPTGSTQLGQLAWFDHKSERMNVLQLLVAGGASQGWACREGGGGSRLGILAGNAANATPTWPCTATHFENHQRTCPTTNREPRRTRPAHRGHTAGAPAAVCSSARKHHSCSIGGVEV